jgi:hypothetical protein
MEVGAGSTAAAGLRRTEVGDGLPTNWGGLDLRIWGWAGAANLGWAGVVNFKLGGVAKFLSIRGLPGVVVNCDLVLANWGSSDLQS